MVVRTEMRCRRCIESSTTGMELQTLTISALQLEGATSASSVKDRRTGEDSSFREVPGTRGESVAARPGTGREAASVHMTGEGEPVRFSSSLDIHSPESFPSQPSVD